MQQCGVCKRMVFSYLLASGQHKARCVPADSPPTTGEDPRRRKARTASRQPSPVSPRPSARHVSPPSKRQKPAAVRPAPPTAKASHLTASFSNSKLPQGAACAPAPVHPLAAALPRSPPPTPVPNPIYLSGLAAPFRRRRSCRRARTKPFSFVPFHPSDFATSTLQHHLPTQPHAAQQVPNNQQAHVHTQAHTNANANMHSWKGMHHSSLDMPPASSATSPTAVSPRDRTSGRQYPDTGAAPAANCTASDRYLPQQMHPRISAAAHTGFLQPSPSAAAYNAAQWAQHAQQQTQQQVPFVQAHPAYANGAAAQTLLHVPRAAGESSGCSQQHARMHEQMHGVQQQQAASHRQAVQPTQQAQRRHPLPISHAEMGKLFQSYLKKKKITRDEFSQVHREAFKSMVLQLSAQRLRAHDSAAEQQQPQPAQQQQQQHSQPQQQQHAQPQQQHLQQQYPPQQLQYAVVLNNQAALGRSAQAHLQRHHAQGSMGPSAVEHSPTNSLHALSGGRVPSCGELDPTMLGGNSMHMHMSGARGGLPVAGAHGGGSISNSNASGRLGSPHLVSPHAQQLASPHAQHINAPHAVHAGGHMHLQGPLRNGQPGMYPMGMQGRVLGHGEAINHMGGLAVQGHHPNARCVYIRSLT